MVTGMIRFPKQQVTVSFRQARPSEVDDLRALVVRSMGYWSRPPEYLAAARELMSLSPRDLRRDDAWVALVNGEVAGFYRISRTEGAAEIEEFHVEPRLIGRGVGRAMFEHAVHRAQRANARWLTWSTDGNALGFYIAMGGVVTGSVPSGIDGDEPLTSMRLDLHPMP
jgi:GNAT superfamily N-acetyltransferase